MRSVVALGFLALISCCCCSVQLDRFDGKSADGGPRDGFGDAAVPGSWITIKAGTFQMGSPAGEPCRKSDENRHAVTLTHDFSMMSSEVTQRHYQDVMGDNPSEHQTCWDCPVDNVTWHQAAAYCNALSELAGVTACYACNNGACSEAAAFGGASFYGCPGYRLPTEAEWEYAYRSGTETAFYSGDIESCVADSNLDQIGWYEDNSGGVTHPVAQKSPSTWGLYDMAGNVMEWINDRYQEDLGSDPVDDPVGAAGGSARVQRGGSYSFGAEFARAADRMSTRTEDHYDDFGFRVVRTVPGI